MPLNEFPEQVEDLIQPFLYILRHDALLGIGSYTCD